MKRRYQAGRQFRRDGEGGWAKGGKGKGGELHGVRGWTSQIPRFPIKINTWLKAMLRRILFFCSGSIWKCFVKNRKRFVLRSADTPIQNGYLVYNLESLAIRAA